MNLDALSIAIQAKEPVLIWGSPGTGKTSIIKGIGENLKRPVEIVMSSVREPTDFAGLPIINGENVSLAPPDWAKRLINQWENDGVQSILFFDEISTAPPAVQAPLLRVCLDKVVGDVQLPDNVAIVAAANPPSEAAGGWDLAPPLANRFLHLDWSHTANDYTNKWVEGMISGFPAPKVKRLPENWRDRMVDARGMIASYIKTRPNKLFMMPENETRAGREWASPRSWDMASRLLAAAQAYGASKDTLVELLDGCVGPSEGVEFLTWYENLDLPDPEEILRNPETFKLPQRGDQAFAVLTSIITAATHNMSPQRWLAAWTVIKLAAKQGTADTASMVAITLIKYKIDHSLSLSEYPVPVNEFKELMPILKSAGLINQ